MIGEILGKALISVKADTSQAKAAIKDLSREEQKAAKERVEAQERINNAWDASLKKHAFVMAGIAAGVAVGIASLKKYEQHLKDIGNTGDGQLRRIQKATESVNQAQDTLQIAFGKVVVAALPVVEAFARMAQELGNIAGGIGAIVERAAGLGGGRVGSYVNTSVKWGRRLMPGIGQLSYGMELYDRYLGTPDQSVADTSFIGAASAAYEGTSVAGESREVIHPNVARALGWVFVTSPDGGYWRPPTEEEKRAKEAKAKEHAKDAKRQADIYADAWRSIAGEIDATSGRARGGGVVDVEGLIRVGDDATGGGNLDQFGDYEATTLKSLDASIAAAKERMAAQQQRESLLASVFGPASEFEMYTRLWQGLEEVVSSSFSAWIDGSKSVGEAMKEALHGFAKQLAGEALLQALRHGAYALGSLAFGDVRGASQHGIAAAKWGAVALTAGVIGKATAPSQGAGAGSGAYAAAGIGGGGGGGRSEGMALTVVMGDGFADSSPRHVGRRTRRAIDLARRYADYEGTSPG